MSNSRTRLMDAVRRAHRFATHEVWQIGTPGEEVPQGFFIKQIRVAILLGSKLVDGTHMVRASALTFATLLSIVPFLALTFYVIQTFNLGEGLYGIVQERVEGAAETVSSTFASSDIEPTGVEPVDLAVQENEATPPGEIEADAVEAVDTADVVAETQTDVEDTAKSRELQRKIIESLFQGVTRERDGMEDPVDAISQAADSIAELARNAAGNRAALTVSGILLVFTTVFGLMRNIENTFNRIWGVRRRRSWYRMLTDYFFIALIMPFVVATVIGVMAALQSESVSDVLGPFAFALRFAQYVLAIVVFSMLYRFVPNTTVKFRYSLLAGIVAGTLWVLLSWGYVQFQFGLARYAVILAAFAQFPMLLMWVYLSWAIVLLGCEVAYSYQNESTFALERFADEASYAYRESVGMRAMIEIGYRFERGLPQLSVEEGARHWNVPMRLLEDSLDSLADAGIVSVRATDPPQYQPARPLDAVRAAVVITALRNAGEEPSRFRDDPRFERMFEELDRHDTTFGGATLKELVESHAATLDAASESVQPVNA